MSERRTASARRTASRTIALTSSGGLLALALPATAATAAPGNACDNRSQQHLRQAAAMRDARGRPRAPGRLPEDRRRQRRPGLPGHAGRGHRGLRRRASTTSPACCEDAGYDGHARPGDVRLPLPVDAAAADAVRGHHESGAYTGSGSGDVSGKVIPVDLNLTGTRRRPAAARRRTSPGSTSPVRTTSRSSSAGRAASGSRRRTPRPPGPRRS